jgi:uncharacterized repeat protein (TIGR03803 family)
MEDEMRIRQRSLPIAGLVVFAVVVLLANAALAGTSVAYSFMGDEDGEYPSTDLVRDGAGNLYGTTVQGGDFGGGSVFQLSPSGTHTVLYSFTGGADGGQPYGGVTLDPQGNLYGTAVIGGTGGVCAEDGCGVAYKLANVGGTWTQTVLHHFTGGDDGSGPGGGMTRDAKGNLYGMTPTGGAFGVGVIFQLHPASNGTWKFRVIHTFTGGDDGGGASAGRLLADAHGHLFGVATFGGANGQGTAFQLTTGSGGFTFQVLYAFKGAPDAGFPYGALTFDGSGNLYGTTYYDGANDLGTVYELTPYNGTWSETVLYSFKGGLDGASPISNMNFDASTGTLYGTTSEGGGPGCGCGTIFKLIPAPHDAWTESVAYTFTGVPDGAFPYNGMVSDGAGNYYGTTVHGGDDGEGAIYQFTP